MNSATPSPPSSVPPILVCHCHLRWDWVYQRPQHLLSRLATHCRVIVEEEPIFDGRPPGLDVLDVGGGVTILRPHRRVDADHDLGRLVEDYLAAVRGSRPLIRWFYSPIFALYGDRLGPDQTVVYDCMDDLASFAGAPPELVDAEARLLERADVVFTGGRAMHEAREGQHKNIHCYPSAVDFGHFARSLSPELPLPEDVADLPRPIVGYYGVIDERLDYELIARLGEHPSIGSVVLVGPSVKVDPATLPRGPKIQYLGQKAYADLPAYLKAFDACMMPWAINDATRSISPTKTLEYMASGKPIVSTAVRDVVRDHGDLVLIAETPDQFLRHVGHALEMADDPQSDARKARAAANGWDAVADAMWRHVLDMGKSNGRAGERKVRRENARRDARNLIVGAGPAGLSAGLHLDDADFLIADKNDRPGGLCRSIVDQGFTFDHAGHIFFTQDRYVAGLFREILADNFHEQVRESWVHLYGGYQRYPFQANLFGLPPHVVKECLLGVIEANAKKEAAHSNGNGNGHALKRVHPELSENFLEFSMRTFGPGITRHFMQPYNFKVWGIPPEKMSSDWIAGRVLTPELDDVIAGALERGRGDMGPNARFGYPLHGGCEMFVSGLAKRVAGRGGAIAQGRTLVRLDPARRRATFRVGAPGDSAARFETVRYDRMFPSVPLPDLIRSIPGAPDAVKEAAAALPTTAVVCVNLGIDREKVTEKHWIYYPEGQETFIFQRIFVQSNASPYAAPPGHSALTFEISHSKYKPLPVRGKAGLIASCVDGLKRTDLWREGDNVVHADVIGMPHAYIPFTPERPRHLELINSYLNELNIHPIGRFGEWKYLNQDGAILSARRVVEEVREARSAGKAAATAVSGRSS